MSYNNFSIGQFFSQDAWNTVAAAWDEMPPTTKLITGSVILAASLSICQRVYSAWQRGCHRLEPVREMPPIHTAVPQEQIFGSETWQQQQDQMDLAWGVRIGPPTEKHVEAIQRLQAAGKINNRGNGSGEGLPLLIQAVQHARPEWCRLLLEHGATFDGASDEEILKSLSEALIGIEHNDPRLAATIQGVISILKENGRDINQMTMSDGRRPLYTIPDFRREYIRIFIEAGLDPTLPETNEPGARNFLEYYFMEHWRDWHDDPPELLARIAQYEGHDNLSLSRESLASILLEQGFLANGEVGYTARYGVTENLLLLQEQFPWLFNIEDLPGQVITSEIFFNRIKPAVEARCGGDVKAVHTALQKIEGLNVDDLLKSCSQFTPQGRQYDLERITTLLDLYDDQIGERAVSILVHVLSLPDLIAHVGQNPHLRQHVRVETLLQTLLDPNRQLAIVDNVSLVANALHAFDQALTPQILNVMRMTLGPEEFEKGIDIFICGNEMSHGVFPYQAQDVLNFLSERSEFSPVMMIKWVAILTNKFRKYEPSPAIPPFSGNLVTCPVGLIPAYLQQKLAVATPADLVACVERRDDERAAYIAHFLSHDVLAEIQVGEMHVIDNCVAYGMDKLHAKLNEKEIFFNPTVEGCRVVRQAIASEMRRGITCLSELLPINIREFRLLSEEGESVWNDHLQLQANSRVKAALAIDAARSEGVEMSRGFGSLLFTMQLDVQGKMRMLVGSHLEPLWQEIASDLFKSLVLTVIHDNEKVGEHFHHISRSPIAEIWDKIAAGILPENAFAEARNELEVVRSIGQIDLPADGEDLVDLGMISPREVDEMPGTRDERFEALSECLTAGDWVRAADLVRYMSAEELNAYEGVAESSMYHPSAPLMAFISGSPSLRRALDEKGIFLDFTCTEMRQNLERSLLHKIYDKLDGRKELYVFEGPEICQAKAVLKKVLDNHEKLSPEEEGIAEVIRIEVRRRIEEAAICARARQQGGEDMGILDEWNSLWPILFLAHAGHWESLTKIPNHYLQIIGKIFAEYGKDLALIDTDAEMRHIQEGNDPRLQPFWLSILPIIQKMMGRERSLGELIELTALGRPRFPKILEFIRGNKAALEASLREREGAPANLDDTPRVVVVGPRNGGEGGNGAARAEQEIAAVHQASLV